MGHKKVTTTTFHSGFVIWVDSVAVFSTSLHSMKEAESRLRYIETEWQTRSMADAIHNEHQANYQLLLDWYTASINNVTKHTEPRAIFHKK